jgi:hypothetical protein
MHTIQKFQIYNPEEYAQMNKNMDLFFDLYEHSMNTYSVADINYNIMMTYRQNAINSFHSIIYSLPADIDTDIFNNTLSKLDCLLMKYLEDVKVIAQKYLQENGHSNSTVLLNTDDIQPYNTVDEFNIL